MPLGVGGLRPDRSQPVVPLGMHLQVGAVLPQSNLQVEVDPLDTLPEGGKDLVGGRFPVGHILGVGNLPLGQVHNLLDYSF